MTEALSTLGKANVGGHLLKSLTDLAIPTHMTNGQVVLSTVQKTGTPTRVVVLAALTLGSVNIKLKANATSTIDFSSGSDDTKDVTDTAERFLTCATTAAKPYFGLQLTEDGNVAGTTFAALVVLPLLNVHSTEQPVLLENCVNAVATLADGAFSLAPA